VYQGVTEKEIDDTIFKATQGMNRLQKRTGESKEMSLCYEFQKWTMITLGLIAVDLVIALVII
jgi:hypothetical protein